MSLVSTDWLEKNLNNVKIIDCSWHMPGINRNPYEEYLNKNRIVIEFTKEEMDQELKLPFFPIHQYEYYLKLVVFFKQAATPQHDLLVYISSDRNYENYKLHLENIDQVDMPYFFKNSIVTIAPTLHESISIPVFEAFYFESPVCASGILAIKDQVSNAGLQFDPTNEDSIYRSLDKMLSNEGLRLDFKSKGKNRLEHFSHERFNKLISPIFI